MADNVDNDACSYIGKSISTSSTSSRKQIDLTHTNHHHHQQSQQQHQHRQHVHQQCDDDDHINKPLSMSNDVSKLNVFYYHFVHQQSVGTRPINDP